MMRTAETYIFEEMGVEMPRGEIPGTWFAEHALPIIVSCTNCGATMALPSAMINDDGACFCPNCANNSDNYEPDDIDSDFGFDPYEGCYTYDC